MSNLIIYDKNNVPRLLIIIGSTKKSKQIAQTTTDCNINNKTVNEWLQIENGQLKTQLPY